MTEELEKEAEEIYQKTDREFMDCQDEGEVFTLGYLAGAEPREKRIAELEAQLEREKNLNQCMSDNNEQLRQLIEKMKNGANCEYGNIACGNYICDKGLNYCNNIFCDCKFWKLKE